MEECLTPVKRMIIICVRKGCTKCDAPSNEAPEDCPYLILHALDTGDGAVQWMPRRYGKTTLLVEQANAIADRGEPVYFLTLNSHMKSYLEHTHELDSRVRVLTKSTLTQQKICGVPPGWLFMDEIRPEDVERTGILHRHRLVSAFYS